MTNQSDKQADARSSTGKALTYEGDFLAYFDQQAVPAGDFNGRLLAWINQSLGTAYTNLPGAQAALAANGNAPSWDGLGLLGGAGAPPGFSYVFVADAAIGDLQIVNYIDGNGVVGRAIHAGA